MSNKLGRGQEIFPNRKMSEGEILKAATYSMWSRLLDDLTWEVYRAKKESGWRQINQSMIVRQTIAMILDELDDIDWSNVDSERSVREAIKAQIKESFCDE